MTMSVHQKMEESRRSCMVDCPEQFNCGDGRCSVAAGEGQDNCPEDCAQQPNQCRSDRDCAVDEWCNPALGHPVQSAMIA